MPLYLWSLWCFIYLKNFFATFLLCDAMHKRSLCRHAVSVCVSVTFVNCVKTSNHILGLFLLSGSHTILVFPYQTSRHYSNRDPPNGGIECKGRQKSRFWPYAWLQCLLLTLQQARCCQHSRRWTTATIPQLMTHITGRTLQVFDHQVPRMITSHLTGTACNYSDGWTERWLTCNCSLFSLCNLCRLISPVTVAVVL